ncbi:hypothetical protein KA005_44470 [bacterium]|nr:hypothetical protein [bacterium]
MSQEISEVRDRPTEIWIKLLVAVTVILVGLIGYMGDRVIVGQDKQLEEMGKINGNLKAYETRISRNEKDIQELESFYYNIKQNGEK